jgi:hypothetical protein
VVHEYLEILPRLNRGVLIHAHDIFSPADYPREAVLNHLCFWSEQYLLQAFLAFNHDFEVIWSSSACSSSIAKPSSKPFPGGGQAIAICHWRRGVLFLRLISSGCGRRVSGFAGSSPSVTSQGTGLR